MPTTKQILAINDRAEKATPGPWEVEPDIRPCVFFKPLSNVRDAAMLVYQKLLDNHPELRDEYDRLKLHVMRHLTPQEISIWSSVESVGYDGNGQIVINHQRYVGDIAGLAKYENACNDADFIAHAREDIPTLLAEIDRRGAIITKMAANMTSRMKDALDFCHSRPNAECYEEINCGECLRRYVKLEVDRELSK